MYYIYTSDTYCKDCGDAARHRLNAQDKELKKSVDSDVYPQAVVNHQETDVSQYCYDCGYHIDTTVIGADNG